MTSIDFDDFEPAITPASEPIVADCPFFHVEKKQLAEPLDLSSPGDFCILTGLTGEAVCAGARLLPGEFLLVPSCLEQAILTPLRENTSVLVTRLPS